MLRARLQLAVQRAGKQGLSPEKIALSLTIGLLLGIIPLVCGSSLICIFIGWRWHLSHPLLQLANYAAYPLQIVLFVPFFATANHLFSSATLLDPLLLQQFTNSPLQVLDRLWLANLQALILWILASAISLPILYRILLYALKRRVTAAQRTTLS
ncbi:MAG: hypothetical protein RBR22_09155 [Desulfuromonas sp.]|nr:hypothetical protein [Desulfuromonas sp.]